MPGLDVKLRSEISPEPTVPIPLCQLKMELWVTMSKMDTGLCSLTLVPVLESPRI